MQLTQNDYRMLEEESWITRSYADKAGLFRGNSLENRDRMGRSGAGDYSGIIFTYPSLDTRQAVGERARLDHPPLRAGETRPDYKYLSPAGQRNHFYAPLSEPAWLSNRDLPVVFVEGEKKGLAVHRAAVEGAALANGGSNLPLYFVIALAGVYGWMGTIGYTVDSSGQRIPVKGPIPDFDLITWDGRTAVICFDANAATNDMVRYARSQLAKELERRGATVYLVDLPAEPGVNGPDDFLARHGLEPFLNFLKAALRFDWRDELRKNDKGKIISGPQNVQIALELAPEWHHVLRYNLFARRVEIDRPAPWRGAGGDIGQWSDCATTQTMIWLEGHGIRATPAAAYGVVDLVAHNRPFHPVQAYLDSLKWDGVARLNHWLTMYLGVKPAEIRPGMPKEQQHEAVRFNLYHQLVGARWLIQAVARIYQPGCQADHVLILEGAQGIGKSSVFRILGGEWCSDDIPDLGSKDAQVWLAGVWIAELAELDAMSKAEISRIKRFLAEKSDHYRPPYGRTPVHMERSIVFAGSVNHAQYLRDDTGARRFWPVSCGEIQRGALERDRDQLWAEAKVRYDDRDPWWLDAPEQAQAAEEEQEARYSGDPWEELVFTYLEGRMLLPIEERGVTTGDVLAHAIHKETGQWGRTEEIRVGSILKRLDWVARRGPRSAGRRRIYEPDESWKKKNAAET